MRSGEENLGMHSISNLEVNEWWWKKKSAEICGGQKLTKTGQLKMKNTPKINKVIVCKSLNLLTCLISAVHVCGCVRWCGEMFSSLTLGP